MKKTILLCTLTALMTSLVYGQDLTGFMGIPFGTNKAQLKTIIKAKFPASTIETDDEKTLSFNNTSFGGRKAVLLLFGLNSNQDYHTAVVLLEPEFESGVFSLYDDVVSEVTGKYGEPGDVLENYLYPYDKSDKYSHGVTALKTGKLDMASLWTFPANDVGSGDDNVIQVKITPRAFVKISYQDGKLINAVVEAKEQKAKQDY